jgi:hypothetical protein
MTKENENWVYEIDSKSPVSVRYVLGEIFEKSKTKALVCIGINPSTATPEKLDTTLKRVQKYVKESGKYGSWYMLNVCPQRATNPDDMDKNINIGIHTKNLQHIENLLNGLSSADIWCAWGSNINKRPYLRDCLKDITKSIQSLNNKNFQFVKKEITNKARNVEHPLHPIASIETEKELQTFDLNKYLESF